MLNCNNGGSDLQTILGPCWNRSKVECEADAAAV